MPRHKRGCGLPTQANRGVVPTADKRAHH
jgi:hypothetical protein